MSQCKDYAKKKEIQHIKIPLYGTVNTCCNKEFVICDCKCFESFGTITFKNEGYCEVEIFKNNLIHPVAVVVPGASFTLVSNPFYRIVAKCKDSCSYNKFIECKKYEHCKRYKSTCCYNECQKDYEWGNEWGKCECYTIDKERYDCHKCALCYKGFVCTELEGVH